MAITPAGVRELSARGHEVLVQAGAGEGSAMADAQFEAQGARIVPDAETVFAQAELVLKVKEPQRGGGGDAAARGRRCSPTCTSRPSPSWREGCRNRARRASRMRRSRTPTGGCRCWRR